MNVFRVVIQLGAILAVLVLYFRRLNPFDPGKKPAQKRATWHLWFKIVIACIPAAVLGILLDTVLDKYLYNPYVVAAMLIIYGVIFIAFENYNQHVEFRIKKVSQISYRTAFYIGLFQLLALIPGTSRSGRDDPRRDDARLFQNRSIGVHLLPWNSGHVRCQPLKDPSLRSGILRDGALLHGSRHGDRVRCFHVFDPVLTRICQET